MQVKVFVCPNSIWVQLNHFKSNLVSDLKGKMVHILIPDQQELMGKGGI